MRDYEPPISTGDIREPLIIINLFLLQMRESNDVKSLWIPAFAGMTFLEVAIRLIGGNHD